MQNWFSLGGGEEDRQQPHPLTSSLSSSSSSSLLADWNSYASSKASEQNTALGVFDLDLESAVRSANDTVAEGYELFWDDGLNDEGNDLWPVAVMVVVSLMEMDCCKSTNDGGVRDIPGNLQSATSNLPSGKSLMYFGILLATGVFFVFIAFTMFLPVIVLLPQKFALCFTLGCCLIIGSFFALKGPKNQFLHMSSKERLPFTLGFVGTMVGTIYVSMVLHSYILSVLFSVLQVLALAYYAVSYFPGGSAGMKFMLSGITSSIMKCFGR
ncbi:Protein transport protein SFT2 [Camellia lanceoleosa]|uniref:Protein transport protein SFT2 n=1 Tax=Camellia lanceoleosa TaxID=1840588 RepID=A0ACC0GUG9_9ERIC|nr:Protein transport protein SFT2 [Camellia lanceoleosa]